ncbi:MAG: hypothetical protein DRJ43_00170 [Thermoprotei archaeon]|nr:MAG: hypothetical protein DRJ43_00170 [Thermoprotei archaeon]
MVASITYRELEKLVSWTRSTSRRIRIYLEGYRYLISIGRYIRAEDLSGREVSWRTAFGLRPPHDVISSFKIRRIVVEEEGISKEFTSMNELLEYAGIRGS